MSSMAKPLLGTPLNRSDPLAVGLAGCWLFNELGGKVAYDSSGNGNNATLSNTSDPATSTSGWGPSQEGGALFLDGTDDYGKVASNGRLNFGTGDFTIKVGVKTNTTMADKFLVGFRTLSSGAGLIVGTGNAPAGAAGKFRCGGITGGDLNSTTSIDDGAWHDCTMVRKSGVVTMNVDGKTEATGSDTTDWNAFAVDRPVFGVNDFNEAGNFIGGQISAIWIWKRALSDDETRLHNAFPYRMFEAEPLLAIVAQGSAYAISQVGVVKPMLGTPLNRDHPLARGLRGCWLFNEGAGPLAWDATGNRNDGTLVSISDPPIAASGWNAGLHGGALAFDGTDDRITANSLGIYSNYSICAQFRIASSVVTAQGLLAWGNEAASERRSLFLWDGGSGPLKLTSSTYASNVQGATGLVNGTDYFGVITVDAAGAANVYLNGMLDGSGTNTLVTPSSDAFHIGNIGAGSFFNGQMSLAYIFDRVLSANEVAALYMSPYAMFEPPGPPYILAPPVSQPTRGMFAFMVGH